MNVYNLLRDLLGVGVFCCSVCVLVFFFFSPLLFPHIIKLQINSEFDTYTGSKIASIDIGSTVVRMAYSPTSSHTVIAILEVSFLFTVQII